MQYRACLLRDALEQSAVIVGVMVWLDVVPRQASDQHVVELQRTHDGRSQCGAALYSRRLESLPRLAVDHGPMAITVET